MKKTALIFGLLLIQLYAIAQEHMFNVVTFSGNPKLENGTALKNGDKIFSNQKMIHHSLSMRSNCRRI